MSAATTNALPLFRLRSAQLARSVRRPAQSVSTSSSSSSTPSSISNSIARRSTRFFTSSSKSTTTTPCKSPNGSAFQTATSKRAGTARISRAVQWVRRYAGGVADGTAQTQAQQVQQSWIKRMWESEVGLKTVHFWAPVMKWAIVIAGIADLSRPAEKLSLQQNLALSATGLIWTRWCFVIRPKNVLLATVNFFLGIVGIVQVTRIVSWRRSQQGTSLKDESVKQVGEIKRDAVEVKEKVVEKVGGARK